MEKKLTAMQILRDKLQRDIKIYNELCINTEVERTLLEDVITIIETEMLHIERGMIEDVYIDGNDEDKDAAKYYTETYKNEYDDVWVVTKSDLQNAIIEICEEQIKQCALVFEEDSQYEEDVFNSKNIAE